MGRRSILPQSRAIHLTVGAVMLAVPATALALSGGSSPASGADSPPLQARLSTRHVAYHRGIVLTGRAPSGEAGQLVALELEPRGSRSWRSIAVSRVRPDGSFRLRAWLRRSGALRAVGEWTQPASSPAPSPQAVSADGKPQATGGASPAAAPQSHTTSAPQQVWVRADLQVPRRAIAAMGNQPASVTGRLLPGQAGRHVLLQELRAGRWYTVSGARTGRRGNFKLRYQPAGNTEHRLRVRFGGDRDNAATSTGAGAVTVYQPSVASWYDDAGETACGFHSYYGVANLSLPCGTKVRFSYHGRAITAVVQDRGPYSGGRQWDLNQNLAHALGFDGVDTVWTAQ